MTDHIRYSRIYEGIVSHTRHAPRRHDFRYRVSMVYLDLDELETIFSRCRWWSLERWNMATFRRGDYHGDPALPLRQAQSVASFAAVAPAPL